VNVQFVSPLYPTSSHHYLESTLTTHQKNVETIEAKEIRLFRKQDSRLTRSDARCMQMYVVSSHY